MKLIIIIELKLNRSTVLQSGVKIQSSLSRLVANCIADNCIVWKQLSKFACRVPKVSAATQQAKTLNLYPNYADSSAKHAERKWQLCHVGAAFNNSAPPLSD
jgi:hypothetical protein